MCIYVYIFADVWMSGHMCTISIHVYTLNYIILYTIPWGGITWDNVESYIFHANWIVKVENELSGTFLIGKMNGAPQSTTLENFLNFPKPNKVQWTIHHPIYFFIGVFSLLEWTSVLPFDDRVARDLHRCPARRSRRPALQRREVYEVPHYVGIELSGGSLKMVLFFSSLLFRF